MASAASSSKPHPLYNITINGIPYDISSYKKYKQTIIELKFINYDQFEQEINRLLKIVALLDTIKTGFNLTPDKIGKSVNFAHTYVEFLDTIHKRLIDIKNPVNKVIHSSFIEFIKNLTTVALFYGKIASALHLLFIIPADKKEKSVLIFEEFMQSWVRNGITSTNDNLLSKCINSSQENPNELIINGSKKYIDTVLKPSVIDDIIQLMIKNKDVNKNSQNDELLCVILGIIPSECNKEKILVEKNKFKQYYVKTINGFFMHWFGIVDENIGREFNQSIPSAIVEIYLIMNILNNMISGNQIIHPTNKTLLKLFDPSLRTTLQSINYNIYTLRKTELLEHIAREQQELVLLDEPIKPAVPSVGVAGVEPEDDEKRDQPVVISPDESLKKRNDNITSQIFQMLQNNLGHYGCDNIPLLLASSEMRTFIAFALECDFTGSPIKNCNALGCVGNSAHGDVRQMESDYSGLHSNPWRFLHRECITVDNLSNVSPLFKLIVESCVPSITVRVNNKSDIDGLHLYLNIDSREFGREIGHVSLHPGINARDASHIKLVDPRISLPIGFILTHRSVIEAVFVDQNENTRRRDIQMIKQSLDIFLLLVLVFFKFKDIKPDIQVVEKKYNWEIKYLKYKAKYLALKKLLYDM